MTEKKRVLLAKMPRTPDQAVLKLVQSFIDSGYVVSVVRTGGQVLEQLGKVVTCRSAVFDILLIDSEMPVAGGLQVLRHIRAVCRDIDPMIIVQGENHDHRQPPITGEEAADPRNFFARDDASPEFLLSVVETMPARPRAITTPA